MVRQWQETFYEKNYSASPILSPDFVMLAAAHGIAAARMRTISYGKERPVAVCNDISCWSQNRRAVTVVGGGQS